MPSVYWTLNENDILTNEYLPNSLNLAPPYPATSWYMNANDVITADIIPRPIDWAPPYPVGKWYLNDDDILTASGIPEVLIDHQGAFAGLANLTKVIFPSTLQSIGRYSFRDTGLTEVTLPAECTYYSTTFPIGCLIHGGHVINSNP